MNLSKQIYATATRMVLHNFINKLHDSHIYG